MNIVTYEMHDLGCIELSVGFVGNLWIRCYSLVDLLNTCLSKDVVC